MKVKFNMDRKPVTVYYQDIQPGQPFLAAPDRLPVLSSLSVYIKARCMAADCSGTCLALHVHSGDLVDFDADAPVFPLDATVLIERFQDG